MTTLNNKAPGSRFHEAEAREAARLARIAWRTGSSVHAKARAGRAGTVDDHEAASEDTLRRATAVAVTLHAHRFGRVKVWSPGVNAAGTADLVPRALGHYAPPCAQLTRGGLRIGHAELGSVRTAPIASRNGRGTVAPVKAPKLATGPRRWFPGAV